MTPEQINIAIAEECGWTDLYRANRQGRCEDGKFIFGYHPKLCGHDCFGKSYLQIPNYSADLNAMHEAEKMLKPRQVADYEVWLSEVVRNRSGFWYRPHAGEVFQVAHATARQRAEAFLRTVGKWKEEA